MTTHTKISNHRTGWKSGLKIALKVLIFVTLPVWVGPAIVLAILWMMVGDPICKAWTEISELVDEWFA